MSMVESQPAYSDARLLVVMGSSGCGKSTVGSALAQRLQAVFIEGDDYHSAENKTKMQRSIALTDSDRDPWLSELSKIMRNSNGIVVASCSALKKAYRTKISDGAGEPVLFIYLHGGSAILAARLAARKDHFMSRDLLDSQLATLEKPTLDEFAITINIDQPVESIVDQIVDKISA